MMSVLDHLPTTISKELYHLVTGEKLGEGIGRQVYVFDPDPNYVIKFELGSRSFQNVNEWKVWNDFREMKGYGMWLAPCKLISPCGTILIQRRTTPIRRAELPESVPAFCTDLKIQNWGLLSGRPVMHDYGNVCYTLQGKLRKASWWGFEEGFEDHLEENQSQDAK